MSPRDRSHLEDMLENAHIATNMSVGLSADILRSAIPALYSTLHAIQIVGEAAAKVSSETRSQLPNIPWAEIVATRHVIVHGYRAVDPAIIVTIVEEHPPPPIAEIRRFLAESPS